MRHILICITAFTCLITPLDSHAQERPRARDLGVPFEGKPGPLNAITDVEGVEVGFSTIVRGSGALKVGEGPVRTGVTAVLPRGKGGREPVMAGWVSMNGNGEMTGTTWIKEGGFMEGPVFITNTHSIGAVHEAAIVWMVKSGKPDQAWSLPVVAETWDGRLNDINGFHVRREHVFEALETAAGGAVREGNVGGGTGMICYQFKCGTGTASRITTQGHTVGVLVQANMGLRAELRVAGMPAGQDIPLPPTGRDEDDQELGSIIIVVATDAPLMPHQLERIARRATLGLARTGATSGNGSGDIFLAFSTANRRASVNPDVAHMEMLSNNRISALFSATVQATEEAIINALVAAETMTGADDRTIEAIPHDRLRELLVKYGRARTP
ncbi:MAG TPA: P1 family peptidase [Burkholderiales bacterium]|nr:P1 family peptidase [Burkholderiales bacterium]